MFQLPSVRFSAFTLLVKLDWTDSTDSVDCLPILLSISVLFLFGFSLLHFFYFGSVR